MRSPAETTQPPPPPSSANAPCAATLEMQRVFESEMTERSLRGDHPEYALGYFVSLELLIALNSRAKKREQVRATQLPRLVLVACNAKMVFHAAAARHKHVDALLLAPTSAEGPATLTKAKRTRLHQIAERVSDPSFRERFEQTRNGDKLLARLEALLTTVLASSGSGATSQLSATEVSRTTATRTNDVPMAVPTIEPDRKDGSTTSLPASEGVQRALVFNRDDDDEEEKDIVLQKQKEQIKVDAIGTSHYHDASVVVQAYAIACASPSRFRAYRLYFKNDRIPLATDISRRCSDRVGKKAIRTYIKTTIGPLPAFDPAAFSSQHAKRQTTFRNAELRDLALVATALSLYSAARLSALYGADPSGLTSSYADIPLVSDELRDASAQHQCVQTARSSGAWLPTGDLHAAHYVPIDVAIQWNNALPVTSRVGIASLRTVLNLQTNLRAVAAHVNVRDHRKVEHFLAAFIRDGDHGAGHKCASWLQRRNFGDRLAVVAARVQAPAFQAALVHEPNGDALAARIELTFRQIEREFAACGFGALGVLWDRERVDDSDRTVTGDTHRRKMTSVFRELKTGAT